MLCFSDNIMFFEVSYIIPLFSLCIIKFSCLLFDRSYFHVLYNKSNKIFEQRILLSYENIKSTIKSKAFIQIKLLFGMSALFYQLKEQKFWPEREEEVEIRIIYKFFCFKENDQMNKQ